MGPLKQRRGGTTTGLVVGLIGARLVLALVFGIVMMVMGRCPMCGISMRPGTVILFALGALSCHAFASIIITIFFCWPPVRSSCGAATGCSKSGGSVRSRSMW